ncbi:carboxypeptidase regulatory-like domain-containing protein, partial [bacterium]|nr:carboxypeptidase regulatory-like domain-containing protein [bacterium]
MQTTNRFKLQPLIRVLTLFLSLSFAVIGTGCAGGTRGTNISGTGTVRSATGVPVQNATVTNPYNQRTATTDTDGNFLLRELELDPNTPTSLVVLDDNKEYITKEFILSEGNSTSFALEITLPSEPNEPAEVKVTQPKSTGSSGEDGVQNLNGNSD